MGERPGARSQPELRLSNAHLAQRVAFLPRPWRAGENGWFWFNPTAGLAAGSILDVPENAFDSGGLFRLLNGVSATLEVPVFFAKTLSINGQYQIRRQFQDELAGALTLGKGPHPWASIKAEVAFNDFVSFGAVRDRRADLRHHARPVLIPRRPLAHAEGGHSQPSRRVPFRV